MSVTIRSAVLALMLAGCGERDDQYDGTPPPSTRDVPYHYDGAPRPTPDKHAQGDTIPSSPQRAAPEEPPKGPAREPADGQRPTTAERTNTQDRLPGAPGDAPQK
jgi:hypothetical protein